MPRPKKNLENVAEIENVPVQATQEEPVQEVFSIDGPGVKCDRVEPGSKAARQLRYFASCPKVRTRIPKGPGEKPGATDTVIVNDLRINIIKGISVDLPEPVADIIEDANYRTDKAIHDTKIADPFSGSKRPALVDQQSNKEAF